MQPGDVSRETPAKPPRGHERKYKRQLDALTTEDAARAARELQRAALREEWAEFLESLPGEERLSTERLKSAAYRGALMRCLRIASGETGASDRAQVKACEAIFRLATEESRLAAEMRGDTTPQPMVQLTAAAAEVLTKEQACEVLQLRRKLAARGA